MSKNKRSKVKNLDFTNVPIYPGSYARYMFYDTPSIMTIYVKDDVSENWIIDRRKEFDSGYTTNIIK